MVRASLFLVPVPLGHADDVTLRAIDVLKTVDYVIGEERTPLLAFLQREGIEKEYFLLNEHTEKDVVQKVLALLKKGKSCALVSDAGTPVFEDPGALLVCRAIAEHIQIIPLPGASSLVPAIVMSGLPTAQFVYGGLLPRRPPDRQNALRAYQNEERTVVFLDAPYRLGPLLKDVVSVLSADRPAAIIFDLSLPMEEVWRGTLGSLLEHFMQAPVKRLFVLVIGGLNAPQFPV